MVYVPTRGDAPPKVFEGLEMVPLKGGSQLDRNVYTDAVRYELERERILRTSWLIAARSEELPNSGDFVQYEGHGETVVITRQPDGGVAAFHNVCQHRGPRIVADEHGCGARRFSCPYHGWVYDTTGNLVGVPEREDFNPEHLAGLRAPAVAAQEWGGWVWINLSPDTAPPLLDYIGPEIVEDLGRFRMEEMFLRDKLIFDVPVNYKAVVDGFNEVYHTTELHHVDPSFTKSARTTHFHLVGNNSMMFVPRPQHFDKLEETGDHHRYTICHYVIFPNAVFNNNPDQIQCFNPIPLDVNTTRFICWEAVPADGPNDPDYPEYRRKAEAHWDVLKSVVSEDIMIYRELAKTRQSLGYTKNTLSERECKITKYHDTMDRLIRDA